MLTPETEAEKQAREKQLTLVQVLDALRPQDIETRVRVLRAAASFYGIEIIGRMETR